jgi:hypothetical protein
MKSNVKGFFTVEHLNKDGELIGTYEFPNGIVDEGMEYLLDAGFNGSSQTSTWYMGLVDNSGWTEFSNDDTMSSHSGWSECNVYTEAGRPEWDAGSASSRQVTNADTTNFSINDTATLKGIFVCTDNTKDGSSGTLWSTAAFSSTVSTSNGDTIKVTYTVSG